MKIPDKLVQELIEAAKDMPRKTPAAGGSGTIHDFKIDAGAIWALDKVLTKIEALERKNGYKVLPHKMLSIDRHNRLKSGNISPMRENFETELAADPSLKRSIEKITKKHKRD